MEVASVRGLNGYVRHDIREGGTQGPLKLTIDLPPGSVFCLAVLDSAGGDIREDNPVELDVQVEAANGQLHLRDGLEQEIFWRELTHTQPGAAEISGWRFGQVSLIGDQPATATAVIHRGPDANSFIRVQCLGALKDAIQAEEDALRASPWVSRSELALGAALASVSAAAACLLRSTHRKLIGAVLHRVTLLDPIQARDLVDGLPLQSALALSAGLLRAIGFAQPGDMLNALRNADATAGRLGWEMTPSAWEAVDVASVSPWAETGAQYASRVSAFRVPPTAFAVRQQRVDLVQRLGLDAGYLDTAPQILAREHVLVSSQGAASVRLTVSLLDAQGRTLKTAVAELPAQARPRWHRVEVAFDHYGAGVRHAEFVVTVRSSAGHLPQAPILTGGSAFLVDQAHVAGRSMIVNGSAEGGIAGWIVEEGGVTTEHGIGVYSPTSPGTSVFRSAPGRAVVTQQVALPAPQEDDPLNLRFTAQFAPQASAVRHEVLARFFDEHGAPVANEATLASIHLDAVEAGSGADTFRRADAVVAAPAGAVRMMLVVCTAGDAGGAWTGIWLGVDAAAIGSRHRLRAAGSRVATFKRRGREVENTAIEPFRSVCWLLLHLVDGRRTFGTGWLWRQPEGGEYVLVTAAHCIYQRDLGLAQRIEIFPGFPGLKIDGKGPSRLFGLESMQLPMEYLTADGGRTSMDPNDFALVRLGAWPGLPSQGIKPAPIEGPPKQDSRFIAFPADKPYPTIPWQRAMFCDVAYESEVAVPNKGFLTFPTDFTGGASGGPLVETATWGEHLARAIFSHGQMFGWGDPIFMLVTTRLEGRLQRMATPLSDFDTVSKAAFVVKTSATNGAGTDDDILIEFSWPDSETMVDRRFILNDMPLKGGSHFNLFEYDNIDGFDVLAALEDCRRAKHKELLVGDLRSAKWKIFRDPESGMWAGNWHVEWIFVFINDTVTAITPINGWLSSRDPDEPHSSFSGSMMV